LSNDLNYFKEYVEHTLSRTREALQGVTDEELNWKPVAQMNNINHILRHTARINLILLPQVLEGTTTGVWSDEYEDIEHTKEELLKDLEKGQSMVLSLLDGMKDVDFDMNIPLWGGIKRRKNGVYMLVSEIDWHGGQIALIRGAYKRTKKGM
jgi:hypothetical protein